MVGSHGRVHFCASIAPVALEIDIKFLRTNLRTARDPFVSSISTVSIVIWPFETSVVAQWMQKCELIFSGISTAIQPFAKTTPFDTTSIAAGIAVRRLARSDCSDQ